jgi:hypothetical protein
MKLIAGQFPFFSRVFRCCFNVSFIEVAGIRWDAADVTDIEVAGIARYPVYPTHAHGSVVP